MSNAKPLQSECTPHSFSKPKHNLHKDFVDLSPQYLALCSLTTPIPTFASSPTDTHTHMNPPPPPALLGPPTLNHPAPPESPDPRTWTNNPPIHFNPHPLIWFRYVECVWGEGGLVQLVFIWWRGRGVGSGGNRSGIGSGGGWRV